MHPSIAAALIAALISVLSWIAFHFFSKARERESRKSQAALQHLERQIEELYGPLEGLLAYSKIVYELEQTRKSYRPPDQENMDPKVTKYFIENHYIPINQQIINLLRTKAYLLDKDKTQEYIDKFIEHAATLECFHNLWLSTGLQSFFMPLQQENWPELLHREVNQTLNDLKKRYSALFTDVTGQQR